jgi:hypothetical protein
MTDKKISDFNGCFVPDINKDFNNMLMIFVMSFSDFL